MGSEAQFATMGSEARLDPATITEFLKCLPYDIKTPFLPTNHSLENEVRRLFESENLQEPYYTRITRLIPISVAATDLCYPDFPFDVQVFIATYTCFVLYIDDGAQDNFFPELKDFAAKLIRGEPFHDPNLTHMFRLLARDLPKYFGPYSTAAIFASTVFFMSGCFIDQIYTKGFSVPRSSARFPRFLRARGGDSEAYAHFLYPTTKFPEEEFLEKYLPTIPDQIDQIDLVQDILSFYKEAVVGTEENIYLLNAARLYSCSPIKILQQTCDRMVSIQEEIQATLKLNDQRLATTQENFLNGYVMWHLSQERYRLGELGLPVGST